MLFNCIASNPVDGKGFFSCAHHVFRIFLFSRFRCFLFSIPFVFTSILLGFLFHKVFHIIFFCTLRCLIELDVRIFSSLFLHHKLNIFAASLPSLCRLIEFASFFFEYYPFGSFFFGFGFYLLFLVLSQTQYTFCLSRCVILQEFCLRCRFHHCVVWLNRSCVRLRFCMPHNSATWQNEINRQNKKKNKKQNHK